MASSPRVSPAARSEEARATVVLAAIGAWTAIVPYLGKALGLKVEVASSVEVVDHVVPGVLVAGAALFLTRIARRRALAGDRNALLAAGLCFLAGFWVLATHVPLLADASRHQVDWGAAIWHSIVAVPIVAIGFWCVLRAVPGP